MSFSRIISYICSLFVTDPAYSTYVEVLDWHDPYARKEVHMPRVSALYKIFRATLALCVLYMYLRALYTFPVIILLSKKMIKFFISLLPKQRS